MVFDRFKSKLPQSVWPKDLPLGYQLSRGVMAETRQIVS